MCGGVYIVKGNNTPYIVFDRSLVHENTRILALWLQQHDRASCLIPEPRTWEKSNKSSWLGTTEAGVGEPKGQICDLWKRTP